MKPETKKYLKQRRKIIDIICEIEVVAETDECYHTNNGWHLVEDGLPEDNKTWYITGYLDEDMGFTQYSPSLLSKLKLDARSKEITHWRKQEFLPTPIY